jgi:hypothetical protein
MKNCNYCGKPIKLVPTASERAAKYGQSPAYYEALFTAHTECQLESRMKETTALLQELRSTR